jgi:hypothetical protein
MNCEQTGEDIFSKMTSFSLLNFKFTQIFLMGQNSFSKMAELSVNSTELSVNTAISEFHRIFSNFLKIRATSEFFARREFSNTAEGRCPVVLDGIHSRLSFA